MPAHEAYHNITPHFGLFPSLSLPQPLLNDNPELLEEIEQKVIDIITNKPREGAYELDDILN